MQAETLDATVRDNINELEICKQRYQSLETINQELQNKVIEIETSNKQILNEYLKLKE